MIQSYQQGSSMLEVLEDLPMPAQLMIDPLARHHADAPHREGFWELRGFSQASQYRALAAELLYLLGRVVAQRDELQATLDENESQAMDRNLYDAD